MTSQPQSVPSENILDMTNMDSSSPIFSKVLLLLALPNQRIIAWSYLLICDKSSVDKGQVSFPYRRTLLTQALNTFPWFTRDIPLFVSLVEFREKSSKLIQYKQSQR